MSKKSKPRIKKVPLDLECLQQKRYGVVLTISMNWPQHGMAFGSVLDSFKRQASDAMKAKPEFSHCQVIVQMPPVTSLQLVIPAGPQGALPVGTESRTSDGGASAQPTPSAERENVDKAKPTPSIESTSLAEAEDLAATAAKISMGAVDHGNRVAKIAEADGLTLEAAEEEFSKSEDETVSRKVYVRAAGPAQILSYPMGERVLGGNHKIAAEVHSGDTFKLQKCRLASSGKDGRFEVIGNDDDLEWLRLRKSAGARTVLAGTIDDPEIQFMRFADLAGLPIDVDVCLTERVDRKRRELLALRVHNRTEIAEASRGRLEILEETSP